MKTRIILLGALLITALTSTLASTSPIIDHRSQTEISATKVKSDPSNAFTVTINDLAMGDYFEMYSFTGKKVFETTADAKIVTVPTDNLYRGVYIYTLKSRDRTVVQSGKLVKKASTIPIQRSGQISLQTLDTKRETITVHNPPLSRKREFTRRTCRNDSKSELKTRNKNKNLQNGVTNKDNLWLDPGRNC